MGDSDNDDGDGDASPAQEGGCCSWEKNITRARAIYDIHDPPREKRGIPFCSSAFAMVWLAYLYVVASTLMFLIGPFSNVWVPQYGLYVTYPFAIMVGAHISYTWTHQQPMFWLQVFAAVASMVVNFLAFFQSMYVVGWNGGLRLTVQGNTTYPPVTSVFNVSSTFDDPLFITLAFLEGQIAFYFMNFLFSLGSLVLAGVVVLRQGSRLPDPDLIMPMPPLGKVPYDRYRVGASSLSALLVIVFWIAYSFISIIQSFGGWVFLTLFPNSANSMLLMMLVLSIYPPMGDGPLKFTKRGPDGRTLEITLGSEDAQRYNTGVGEQSVHFFFGWILAVVFSVWTVINNSNWRTANSMPITCGDLVSFLGNSTTFTGFGVPISFFGHQTVRYAPFLEGNSANGQNIMQASSSLTCMDDIFNWILLFFGFIVFICGSCTVFISLCPRNRHLQAHQKETGFADKAVMRKVLKDDENALDPQGGEARKTKKWPRFRRTGGLNIPIS
jgi:hypothetical protein